MSTVATPRQSLNIHDSPLTTHYSPKPKLLDQLRNATRVARLDRRVEDAYVEWVTRFIRFHKLRHPSEMGQPELAAFLKHLAVTEHASRAVQAEVQAAIRFLYRDVLKCEPSRAPRHFHTAAALPPAPPAAVAPQSPETTIAPTPPRSATPSTVAPTSPSTTASPPSARGSTVQPINSSTSQSPTAPKLLDRVSAAIQTLHYSRRTDQSYQHWIRRFILFHKKRHPSEMAEPEVNQFLSHLAVNEHVAASTQNQALAALLFLYQHVLAKPLGRIEGVVRAKRPKRLPVVLTADEMRHVLQHMEGVSHLICRLLYGSGLRLLECMRLRVKDIDFQKNEITVRDGKGQKDRVTMLPAACKQELLDHLKQVREQHAEDLKHELGRAPLPFALARKYKNADREWGWQYVFPATTHYLDRETGNLYRHHFHESVIQKAMHEAVRLAGLAKPATPHSLRHSFATELILAGYDIRTVAELMGHRDIQTTMIYLHVLNRGGMGVRSPADRL